MAVLKKGIFFLFSRKFFFCLFWFSRQNFCFREKIFILFLFSRQISNQVFSF